METAVKLAQPRATDRVLEALSTLAALLDRTIGDVKTLDEAFQNRLLQAVHDTEASLQEQAASHVERAVANAHQSLSIEVTEKLREQFEAERDRLNRELDRATQSAALWELERARLNDEIDTARRNLAEKSAEHERLVAEMKQDHLRTAAVPPPSPPATDDLVEEIQRVEKLIRQINDLIDDPATDLSLVIRKNVERTELDSYLKGIRFAIDGHFRK